MNFLNFYLHGRCGNLHSNHETLALISWLSSSVSTFYRIFAQFLFLDAFVCCRLICIYIHFLSIVNSLWNVRKISLEFRDWFIGDSGLGIRLEALSQFCEDFTSFSVIFCQPFVRRTFIRTQEIQVPIESPQNTWRNSQTIPIPPLLGCLMKINWTENIFSDFSSPFDLRFFGKKFEEDSLR